MSINSIRLHEIQSLRDVFESHDGCNDKVCGQHGQMYNKIVDGDFILSDIVRNPRNMRSIEAFVRAGPQSKNHFDPAEVRAAIVTCGGLCPGLNNVIREIVHTLTYLYGVTSILGIR